MASNHPNCLVEMRWVGRHLQKRERAFRVDASGAFCGLTDFGRWETVAPRKELPPLVNAAKQAISAYQQHGLGPEFPELEKALEALEELMDNSIYGRM